MWFYLFTSNPAYPDPLEEIDALAALEEEGQDVFLKLASGIAPPLSRASSGEVVFLCTRSAGAWSIRGECLIEGDVRRGSTPRYMEPLYGPSRASNQCWRQLKGIELYERPRGESDFNFPLGTLPARRASVRNLGTKKKRTETPRKTIVHHDEPVALGAIQLPGLSGKLFLGVDLTAGTIDSFFRDGPKKFVRVHGPILGDEVVGNWHREQRWDRSAHERSIVARGQIVPDVAALLTARRDHT